MYILHRRPNRSRSYIGLLVLVGVLLVAGYIGKAFLHDDTVIDLPPPAVTTHVTDRRSAAKQIDEVGYSFSLPGDWEAYTPVTTFQGMKSWRIGGSNKGIRTLDVYIDSPVVSAMAINRVLPVEVSGDHLSVSGEVSDNCTNFTPPNQQQTAAGKTAGKWQNVQFLCDTGNYLRNVSGIAAPGGVNNVNLTGASGAKHQLMITYTDNAPSPDYGILTAAVQSFRLK